MNPTDPILQQLLQIIASEDADTFAILQGQQAPSEILKQQQQAEQARLQKEAQAKAQQEQQKQEQMRLKEEKAKLDQQKLETQKLEEATKRKEAEAKESALSKLLKKFLPDKPMKFEVGEGLNLEQKQKAQEVITKKTVPVGPEPKIDFGGVSGLGAGLMSKDENVRNEAIAQITELGLSIGMTSPVKKIPVFKGAKDLTTKFLEYAKGKTTLSKQEIMDFARRPELKKGEADLLNVKIKEFEGQKLSAQEFADSMRRDLLELKPVKVKDPQYSQTTIDSTGEYEGLNAEDLPSRFDKTLGKNYEEVVFESPITTNGSGHYPNSKNYFAHARGDEVVEGGKKIWREQEIQSDLLQKEGFERQKTQGLLPYEKVEAVEVERMRNNGWTESQIERALKEAQPETRKKLLEARAKEIQPLEPFLNDRFGERIMRERIKEKASKGYEKYRLPTGETIGKIEGFETNTWHAWDFRSGKWDRMNPEKLEVGLEIRRPLGERWIITDILGEGRFKAVPKDTFEEYVKQQGGKNKALNALEDDSISEIFDLTGKSNPQYRRYSDWGKFLKNKYGGKEVIDKQGNSWMEIDLKKEMGRLPIEAFGVVPLIGLNKENER